MINLLLTGGNGVDALTVVYIGVSVLLGIAVVAALVSQIFVAIGYVKGNRMQNAAGLSGAESARKLLDENGMPDVQVKKCTFWRMFFFGNHYSIAKKTVYLRKYTIDKTSVTSVALAAQKVALAKQHRDGDKKMIVRGRLQGLGVFAPVLFIPLVVIGLAVDLLVTHSFIFTVCAIALGFLFIVFGLVVTVLNIPVEKKAIVCAEEWLKSETYLTAEEYAVVKKIYRSYMVQYVMQFVVALLRILQLILKVLAKAKRN